jgi:hypothetical protein
MQEGVGPTFSCPLREGERFIKMRQSPLCVLSLGFKLGEVA